MLSLGSLSNLSNKSFFPYMFSLLFSYLPILLFSSLTDKPPKDVTLPKGDTVSRETNYPLAILSTESPITYLAQLFIIQNQNKVKVKVNMTVNQ